jgi:hypothetical protein
LSKSFTYIVAGSAAVARRRVLSPRLPTTKSTRPSPVKSPATTRFHHPRLFSSPGTFSRAMRPPPALRKIVTGIHSPTTTRSAFPSASTSRHSASVTMPTRASPGAACSVTSANRPRPSFRSSMLRGSAP